MTLGGRELKSHDRLAEIGGEQAAELTLLRLWKLSAARRNSTWSVLARRPPLQAAWLERVEVDLRTRAVC